MPTRITICNVALFFDMGFYWKGGARKPVYVLVKTDGQDKNVDVHATS